MKSAYSLTSQDWLDYIQEKNISVHVLNFWLEGLYKDPSVWERHVSRDFLTQARLDFDLSLPRISKVLESADGTIKFQLAFADQLEVETVLIPFHKRFTVCLSTQVGCGMNCSFCYTGTQGLKRHLSAGEIVGQYLVARNWLLSRNEKALSPSIVFMGQGEPLHNALQVKKAIDVLNDRKLAGVGHRQMTLSTVGYLPAIKSLHDFAKINIALSLHSPFQEERTTLIPINAKYPLEDVLLALDEIPLLKRQFITYEYLLIGNLNMSEAHADALARLLSPRRALVNLIPFNPFPGSSWQRPEASDIERFRQLLVSRKLRVMVRQTKGDEILAACGQLKINQQARDYAR